MGALRYATTQELVLLALFTALFALLVAALVLGAIRRRHPLFLRRRLPEPAPVRFVPHWQMMLMLGVFALSVLAAIVTAVVRAFR